MRRLENKYVAKVPLFDRLLDLDPRAPSEPRPFRTLSRGELLDSVKHEVERLLNSRCSLTADEIEAMTPRDRSVIDYGVPDFGWVDSHSEVDRQRMAAILASTIAAFEPRLKETRVKVDHLSRGAQRFSVIISGMLIVDRLGEPVSFPIVVATTAFSEEP
jgi:type VI secretion system protein ImpF